MLLLLKVPTLKNSIKFELETQCLWSVVLSAMFYERITWAFFFITLHHFGGTSRTDLVASRLRVKASTSPGFESLATCGRALGPLAPILPLSGNNCNFLKQNIKPSSLSDQSTEPGESHSSLSVSIGQVSEASLLAMHEDSGRVRVFEKLQSLQSLH